jgi:O-antigen/teichoic acid export membrane protein
VTYLPAKLLPALTPFITVPILTHLFAPDEYGRYSLAFGVSELLLAATSTGFAAGAVRFYTVYKLESNLPAYFSTLFLSVGGIVLAACGLSGAALIAFRSQIDPALVPLLWVSILTFAVGAVFSTLMHIVRAQERSRWYTGLELFSRYGTVVFSLGIVLLLSADVIGLLWGQFVALLLAIIPLLWITTRGIPLKLAAPPRASLNLMWIYALPLTLGNVAFWGLRLSDRYFVEFYRGTAEVGLYSVSCNIAARTIDLIVGLFLLVPGPIIMRMWEEEGREKTEETLRLVTRLFFLVVTPAVVGLSVTAVPLVRSG